MATINGTPDPDRNVERCKRLIESIGKAKTPERKASLEAELERRTADSKGITQLIKELNELDA